MAPAKHWCFTINNPDVDDAMAHDMLSQWPYQYIAVQREIGGSGTEHLQGYVEFDKPMRLTGIKKLPLAGMAALKPSQYHTKFVMTKKY